MVNPYFKKKSKLKSFFSLKYFKYVTIIYNFGVGNN